MSGSSARVVAITITPTAVDSVAPGLVVVLGGAIVVPPSDWSAALILAPNGVELVLVQRPETAEPLLN